eukprot:TRINITY_DN18676_c0_g1_i1.p1 TRINITY_DN18676_c0_g1~~TRINITY_DN18676_c0_g1_i1.p1  ORF type:complete len:468 (-),score=44.67 TRINITY_DN18676_c0_g1_i1:191-1594(-)
MLSDAELEPGWHHCRRLSTAAGALGVLGLIGFLVCMRKGMMADLETIIRSGPSTLKDWEERKRFRFESDRGMIPHNGETYIGVLPNDGETPDTYAAKLGGFTPPVFTMFCIIPGYFPGHHYWLMQQLASQGAIIMLTAEPSSGLSAVTWEGSQTVADFCADFEAKGGSGCLVRFGHEMNGGWYLWSQQPQLYIEKFRLVGDAVRAKTKRSGMLWAPNHGEGYPFPMGPYAARPGTPEYFTLDTNKDGRVDMNDDPYGPFYPGDEHVEWVGLTLYHWGLNPPWGANVIPAGGTFVSKIRGEYTGSAIDQRGLPDFYEEFCGKWSTGKKPFAIAETGAMYNTARWGGAADPSEYDMKHAWWMQVFGLDTFREFPKLKFVNWFNVVKSEKEIGWNVIDWSLTSHTWISDAFIREVLYQQGGRLRFVSMHGIQNATASTTQSSLNHQHRHKHAHGHLHARKQHPNHRHDAH